MEKKKKPANYIIPATFFQALSPVKKNVVKPVQKTVITNQPKKVEAPKPKLKTPILKTAQRRTSSLSLKSIHQKKEIKKTQVEENYDNHPKDSFTEEKLQTLWASYASLLQKKGQRSMASIVATDVPKLEENFKISFSVPNKLMLDQFQKGRPKLLGFLREQLNNYGIEIILKLNEKVEKKFAYTNQEKFLKLKEKNPLLEKLRQTFELDL